MKKLVKILLILVLSLVVLGAVIVFSTSSTASLINYKSFYYVFESHIAKVILALLILIPFLLIPYENYKKYSKHLIFLTVLLLFLTLIIGTEKNGATRWIDFRIFSFQPAELAKLILIIHLARMLERKGDEIKSFKKGLIFPLFWIFLVSGLIFIQPNVSTSLIIVFISFTLLFIAGARIKHLFFTLITVLLLSSIPTMLISHSRVRIISFFNSLSEKGDVGLQVQQAKIALGSGGLFGVGIGHSRQSDLFVPEPYGDFIFSILGEETGFIGVLIILFIYLTLFLIGLIIAKRSNDNFGQLIAFGLSFNIISNAFIHVAVVSGILPTTGITLPFISFGGTSLIMYCVSIGIIINIALNNAQKQNLKLAYQ